MFQLVSLMVSSGDFYVVLTSVTNYALGYKLFLLLLYITVLYNISGMRIFKLCLFALYWLQFMFLPLMSLFARSVLFACYICTLLAQCCLLYTSPSPRDQRGSRMPSSA